MALGTGYPAIVAVSHIKQAYSVILFQLIVKIFVKKTMKLAFTEDNIKNYVIRLIDGKESISKFVKDKPKLHKTEAWDG